MDPVTGQAVGLFPDVVREMERRTGHTITMSLQPFARIDRELVAGNQDCTIVVTSAQRAEFTVQGELLSGHVIGVLMKKGLPAQSIKDLNGRTISVLRGLTLGPAVDDNPAIGKSFDTDYLMGLRKVVHGRLDGVGGAIPTIRYQARQNDLLDHFGPVVFLEEVELRLQCARQSPNLPYMDSLNQSIRDIIADGTLQKLKEAHDFQ
jgi:polar amino acid transport system substrate-binding protein